MILYIAGIATAGMLTALLGSEAILLFAALVVIINIVVIRKLND